MDAPNTQSVTPEVLSYYGPAAEACAGSALPGASNVDPLFLATAGDAASAVALPVLSPAMLPLRVPLSLASERISFLPPGPLWVEGESTRDSVAVNGTLSAPGILYYMVRDCATTMLCGPCDYALMTMPGYSAPAAATATSDGWSCPCSTYH